MNDINTEQNKKEQKHDISWMVSQIFLRQLIVGIPMIVVSIMIIFAIMEGMGINLEGLMRGAQSELESAKKVYLLGQILGIILFPLSYIGMRWGCKYVVKNTFIGEKEFSKIGYWVGLIPIFLSLLARDLIAGAVIFGVFVTPKIVTKWLDKFAKDAV